MYLRFLYSNDSLPKPLGGKYTFIFGIHSMSFFFYYHHKFTFYISCSVLSVFCLDKSCKWVALAMEEGKCCQNQICTLKERWHECLVKGSWCIHQEKSATAWALHTLQKTMWSIKTLIWPRCVKGKKKKVYELKLNFLPSLKATPPYLFISFHSMYYSLFYGIKLLTISFFKNLYFDRFSLHVSGIRCVLRRNLFLLVVMFVLRSNTDEVNAGSGSAKSLFFIYFCQSLQPDQSNNMSADLPNGFPPYTPVKNPARFLELASFHRWERWPLLWRHSNPVDHCHLVLVPPVFHDADSEWIFAGCSCLCVCVWRSHSLLIAS